VTNDGLLHSPQYDPAFDEQMKAVPGGFFRADELIQGVEWLLCHDPTIGTHIHGDIWFIPAGDVPGMPRVGIYYSFTDSVVTMKSLRIDTTAEESDTPSVVQL
jgi:hypothetical protein